MNKPAPFILIISIYFLMITSLVLGILVLSNVKKLEECRNSKDIWCWNDWVCDDLGTQNPLPPCNGNNQPCFGPVKDIYQSFFSNCDPTTKNCNCPDIDKNSRIYQICNMKINP
jgi:hypothetical protein